MSNAAINFTGNFGDFTHKGNQKYAFDFPEAQGTLVVAARGGVVLKKRESGCLSCWDPDAINNEGEEGDCVDCDCCLPECPVEAIFRDLQVPTKWTDFITLNADRAAALKSGGTGHIVEKKDAKLGAGCQKRG